MKKYIILFAVVFLLTYVTYAFITWNIDISTWSEAGRFTSVIISGYITLMAFLHDYIK